MVDAVGQRLHRVTHPPVGQRDDLVERDGNGVRPVASEQLLQAAFAETTRRDLREIVAASLLGNADVEQYQVEQIGLQNALPEQLHDRDSQAFLVDLRHAPGHAAGRHAADIRMVRDVAHEADQPVVGEDGDRHIDVGQVGAAGDMRVVSDEDVAGRDVVAVFVEQCGHEPGHRGEVDRQAELGLHDQAPRRIHDRGRMVAPLLDVGRVGAPHERNEGFVGDRA